jgi:hypothetical protein
VWSALTGGTEVVGPHRGEAFIGFQTTFFPSFRMEVVGDATVLGDQVALPVHVNVANEDGFTVLTLREVDGELPIAEIHWLPQ